LYATEDGFSQKLPMAAGRQFNYYRRISARIRTIVTIFAMGNKSVPIQLAQCRFPGLAISNAKMLIYFSYKIYRSSFIKQQSQTIMA